MEKSEIEHYLRDIWVREFEKEEKLVIDEFNKELKMENIWEDL